MTSTAPINTATLSRRPGRDAPVRQLALETPVGVLVLEGDDEQLTRVWLPSEHGAPEQAPRRTAGNGALAAASRQLTEYFRGRRRRFELPLAMGGTPFQQSVWWALADIPYGTTVTYGELAAAVGRPGACRAVGQANGANPLPIVLPCHRVVASGGRLGGYGGGLDLKRALLGLEGRRDFELPAAAG